MKKYVLILAIMSLPFSAAAEFDPFSVYTVQPPQGCVDFDINEHPLSLPELVQIGICTNPSLNYNYMSVKVQEAAEGQAKSEYLPSLDVSGSTSAANKKIEGASSNESYPYSGNIGLSWLLYDFGGRSARTERAKAYLESAKFSYNTALQDMVLSVHTAYMKLLGARESLKSAEANEKTFKKSYEESTKRYELGLASLSDKLQAQTSYEQSSLTVVQAENTVKQNQGNLAVILNLSPNTEFTVLDPPTDRDITQIRGDNGVEDLIKFALEQRPEIKGKESDIKAKEENVRAVSREGLPKITAKAEAGYGDNWKSDSLYTRDSSIGLNVSIPLFTGFSRTYKVSQAKYEYKQARLALEDAQASIRNEVWSSYHDYVTALKSYEISKQILKSAEENERVAFVSYEVGKTDIINLLTAGSQLADAREGLVVSFYSVLISKANLYRSIGRF